MRKLVRLLWIIISVVMTGLAISFTVSNDAVIALSLWPLSQTLNIPIWLSVIAAFVIGGSLGGALMWGQALATRAQLWRSQTQIRKLQTQVAQQAGNAAKHSSPHLPGE
jgi:uncharacterized integral membrane protein